MNIMDGKQSMMIMILRFGLEEDEKKGRKNIEKRKDKALVI